MRVAPVSAAFSAALKNRKGTATKQRMTDPRGVAFAHLETGKVDFEAQSCPPGFVEIHTLSREDFERLISTMIRKGGSTRDISRLRIRRKQLA